MRNKFNFIFIIILFPQFIFFGCGSETQNNNSNNQNDKETTNQSNVTNMSVHKNNDENMNSDAVEETNATINNIDKTVNNIAVNNTNNAVNNTNSEMVDNTQNEQYQNSESELPRNPLNQCSLELPQRSYGSDACCAQNLKTNTILEENDEYGRTVYRESENMEYGCEYIDPYYLKENYSYNENDRIISGKHQKDKFCDHTIEFIWEFEYGYQNDSLISSNMIFHEDYNEDGQLDSTLEIYSTYEGNSGRNETYSYKYGTEKNEGYTHSINNLRVNYDDEGQFESASVVETLIHNYDQSGNCIYRTWYGLYENGKAKFIDENCDGAETCWKYDYSGGAGTQFPCPAEFPTEDSF